MAKMWALVLTDEEWTWLNQVALSSEGVPEGFKFALESAVPAQEHVVYAREWAINHNEVRQRVAAAEGE